MKSKKIFYETGSLFSTITLLVILAVVGIVSQWFLHTRLDLTEEKRFTLGKAAVKTLEELPDIVTIKLVMSSDLPAQFVQIKTHIKDFLEEFEARADGKIDLVYYDPGEDEERKKHARAMGIQEVQMQEQSRRGMEIKKGFFGLAVTYGDKKEIIPVLNNLESFEYDLIVKIKKLTGNVKKVGIIEGKEENKYELTLPGNPPQTARGFDKVFGSLKTEIEKLYTISYPKPDKNKIPDDLDLIIVTAPRKLTEMEIFHIDQHLMKGKSAIFLTPGVNVDIGQGLRGQAAMNGYDGMLRHYGITVKKNVLLETRNWQLVPFGNSIFPIPYPYWIVVPQGQLNSENAITSKLGQISFPWMSSLEIDSSKIDSGSQVIVLASSSKDSWEETGRFMLFPRDLKEYLPVNQSSQPLAVMKTGKFQSYYRNRPLPGDSGAAINPGDVIKESRGESRLLVVPNVLFVTNFYVGLMRSGGNQHFMLNAIDQLALDPDLINIRSRAVSTRPIDPEKLGSKTVIVLVNMLAAPLLLLMAGIFIVVRRRKRDSLS